MTKFFPNPWGRRAVVFYILVLTCKIASAQSLCGPNTKSLNLSLLTNDQVTYFAQLSWDDFLTNAGCALPVDFQLMTSNGIMVSEGNSDETGALLTIPDACHFLDRELTLMVTNASGTSGGTLTFKKGLHGFEGRSFNVFCTDRRIDKPLPEDTPSPYLGCSGPLESKWTSDWVSTFVCQPGAQDTAKIILREWETFTKNGVRHVMVDTIVVYRFPILDGDHFYCAEKDTLYCGESTDLFGPYIIVEAPPGSGFCDTIPLVKTKISGTNLQFLPSEFDPLCGIQLHLDTTRFGRGCDEIYKLDLEVKQVCPGVMNEADCFVAEGLQAQSLSSDGTYWRCTFWVTNLDTVPPQMICDYSHFDPTSIIEPEFFGSTGPVHCFPTPEKPNGGFETSEIVMVTTSLHECSASTAIPSVCVFESWSDIKGVKATIQEVGSFTLIEDTTTTCTRSKSFIYPGSIRLPVKEVPYQILYEAIDDCHNVDSSFCYILVKDNTKPVAVADKGSTVSLSDKLSWIKASDLDEGSYDGCQINLILGRRSDWTSFMVDLCDDLDSLCVFHDEVIYRPTLEQDKHANEVEAHYAKTLEWLSKDGSACSNVLLNAWHYGLFEAVYKSCGAGHLSSDQFRDLFRPHSKVHCELPLLSNGEDLGCLGMHTDENALLDEAAQIGGGWSFEIPVGCQDACQKVTIELLVMDYWCNWSKTWTSVLVEDRTPVSVVQDVSSDVDITCKTFKERRYDHPDSDHPVSLQTIVSDAEEGQYASMQLLDEIFGGYQKAWIGPHGEWLNGEGLEVKRDLILHDSACECTETVNQVRVYDDHLGYLWVDSLISECKYDGDSTILNQGFVLVNCSENVKCEQTVWSDIDHCGQGYIYRKFKIWQECISEVEGSTVHMPDTVTRVQKISVFNDCRLQKEMFALPEDTEVYSCGIEYDPEGSGQVVGAADPQITGIPEYQFDDDCRIVGIAHEDKVFKIVGGDRACHKIIRTWYFADWCQNDRPSGKWWRQSGMVSASHVQKIVVVDTVPPECIITGPVEDGGTISSASCTYDFQATLDGSDVCGVLSYYWELLEDSAGVVRSGNGEFQQQVDDFATIEARELTHGSYHLRVRVVDECQNESYCNYDFAVEIGKKPTPVCLTSLTIDLVPEDKDNDGVADGGTGILWANEFNHSSQAPCGFNDDDLTYLIEFPADNVLDTSLAKDHMKFDCFDQGIHIIRMWVVSPTGSADYCDVTLIIQNNLEACDSSTQADLATVEGSIKTQNELSVANAQVFGESGSRPTQIAITDDSGGYSMSFLLGDDFLLSPAKEGDDPVGVTTADLIILANHINNTVAITDPYLRIASDVTFDGIINATDLLALRNFVVNNSQEIAGGKSWRFVWSGYDFLTDLPEAEDFPQIYEGEISEEIQSVDFIGIKIGDLNQDHPGTKAGRSGEGVVMVQEDSRFSKNESVTIQPVIQSDQHLEGLQFELHFDPDLLKFEKAGDLGVLQLRDEDLGLSRIDSGRLYCSWISEGTVINGQEALFELKFTALEEGKISNAIALVPKQLRAEIYEDPYHPLPLTLSFEGVDSERLLVMQNEPNPFQEETRIPFYIESDSEVNFSLSDIHGREIMRLHRNYKSGDNTLIIGKNDLKLPGIYYYTIKTKDKTETRKMAFFR